MNRIVLTSLLISFLSCNPANTTDIMEYDFKNTQWVKTTLSDSFFSNAVFVAYDPECPVCLLYKTSIDYMAKTFHELAFYIVIPKDSDTAEIQQKLYSNSNLKMIYDPFNRVVNILKATTTPHAFLIDVEGKTLYNGKIDDRVKALGVKSQTADTLYLQNAIKSYLNNEVPSITQTQPIGCLIQ